MVLTAEQLLTEKQLREHEKAAWIAIKHHRTHKKQFLDFNKHQYQRAILVDKSRYVVIIKSTQCGISEILVVICMSWAIQGYSVFYVLPNYTLVKRFVQNRVNKSIMHTPYYHDILNMSKNPGEKKSDSLGLKDIGDGVASFVSSESLASFAEFPADRSIVDELDLCDFDNLEMVEERLSHSSSPISWEVANPTLSGRGIDARYALSNQMKWNIQHDCGEWVNPDWWTHVVRQVNEMDYELIDQEWTYDSGRDIHMICHNCGRPIDRYGEGLWIPKYESRNDIHGYQISKLFSGTTTILDLNTRFKKGLRNDGIMQRFYNADMGLARTSDGAKITQMVLDRALGDWPNKYESMGGYGVMGIDVGKVLNIIIGKMQRDKTIKIICIMEIQPSVKQVKMIQDQYAVRITVMDSKPELNLAKNMRNKLKNLFLCDYHDNISDHVDFNRGQVKINRTASLDAVKEDLILKNIMLPVNAPSIEEFYSQMTAADRILDMTMNKGKGSYRWEEGSKADHYFHAMNYMRTAGKLLVYLARS